MKRKREKALILAIIGDSSSFRRGDKQEQRRKLQES